MFKHNHLNKISKNESMVHYLIEFRFFGNAKGEIKRFIWDVDKKFKLKRARHFRPVPHVTLIGPLGTRQERRLVRDFKRLCENFGIMKMKVDGYGTFEDTKVIFINVTPDENLKEFRWELFKTLQPYCSLRRWDLEKDFAFHATIAMKINSKKFKKVKKYIESLPPPNFNHILLRVTLIKNNKILCEYDFMTGRLLNRRQAKSSKLLEISFRKLEEYIKRNKLENFEIVPEISMTNKKKGSLGLRIKNLLKRIIH